MCGTTLNCHGANSVVEWNSGLRKTNPTSFGGWLGTWRGCMKSQTPLCPQSIVVIMMTKTMRLMLMAETTVNCFFHVCLYCLHGFSHVETILKNAANCYYFSIEKTLCSMVMELCLCKSLTILFVICSSLSRTSQQKNCDASCHPIKPSIALPEWLLMKDQMPSLVR